MNKTPESQAPVRRRKKSQVRRDRMLSLIAALVTLVIVVLVIVIATSLSAYRERPTPVETTAAPDYIPYMGYHVNIYPGLAVNELDAASFSVQNGLLSYDDGKTVSENGIDVSEHQGEIDWESVAGAGIDFAFLRIGYRGYTEGNMYPDARFEENYEAARAAGIRVGVYFYSQAVSESEAAKEAEFVLQLLGERELDLPVTIDWEYADADSARTDDIGGSLLTSISDAFCSRIESAGYSAAIYFNKDTGYIHYDLGVLSDYDFWIADYSDTPVFYYAHEYWQYTDEGHVAGISETVDLNLRFVAG